MKSRPPLRGYNHNLRHGSRSFHVQTEDSGLANPRVFTHLFHGGTIIASKRSNYSAEDSDDAIQRQMQLQHKAMLKELRHGQFDERILQLLGAPPAVPEALPGSSVGAAGGDLAPARTSDSYDLPASFTSDTQEEIAHELIAQAIEGGRGVSTPEPSAPTVDVTSELVARAMEDPAPRPTTHEIVEPVAPPEVAESRRTTTELLAVTFEAPDSRRTTDPNNPRPPELDNGPITPLGAARPGDDAGAGLDDTMRVPLLDSALLDETFFDEDAPLPTRTAPARAVPPPTPLQLAPKTPIPTVTVPRPGFIPGAATAAVLDAAANESPSNSTVFDQRVPEEVLRLMAEARGEVYPPATADAAPPSAPVERSGPPSPITGKRGPPAGWRPAHPHVTATSAEGVVVSRTVHVGSARALGATPSGPRLTPLPVSQAQRASSYNAPGNIFGETPAVETSLDEAILAYLSDDPAPKK